MKKLISLFLLISIVLTSLIFTGCNKKPESTEVKPTEAATETQVDFENSKEMLKAYFKTFTKGDNPLYGTWQIKDFDLISYIIRNDGFAEMAMGTEGTFSQLALNTEKKTLATDFYIGISGTYNYDLSEDNQTLTLTSDAGELTLEKQKDYNFVPKAPKEVYVDKDILGWWKSDTGLIYYFGKDGIMYSNIITMETCYTYQTGDGIINAVYNVGGDEEYQIEYSCKNNVLTIDGNKFKPYNPFE